MLRIAFWTSIALLALASPLRADDFADCRTANVEALAACDRVIALRDDKASLALSSRGFIRLKRNEIDLAFSDYNDAIKADAKNAGGYNGRGLIYAEHRSDLDRAISDYNEAIKLDPKFSSAFYNRGSAWRRKGDVDRALADYNESIRLNPNFAYAWGDRGVVYHELKGDLDRAIPDYNEAIRLDPKFSSAFYNRGSVYRRKGDFDRALADYSESIRLNPNFAYAFSDRALVYRTKGDLDRALSDYNDALRLSPKYANGYLGRGITYRDKGDADRAMADFSEAIKLDPKSANAYHYRGVAYYGKGDLDRALSDYSESIKLDPKSANAYLNRAIVYRMKGNFDAVVADCTEAIKIDATNASSFNERGFAYHNKKDSARALADYNEAIRLDPKFAGPYNNRGVVYHDKREIDRAIVDYNEALRLDPKYSGAYLSRGIAWRDKGDPARARADLSEALRLDPANESARKALAGLPASPGGTPTPPPAPTPTTPSITANFPPVAQGRRVALVIGNTSYRKMPVLRNAVNDAADVGDELKRLGFDVTVELNADRPKLNDAIARFSNKVGGAEVAVFYYSGHGMQFNGKNYLLPLEAELQSIADVNKFKLLALDDVIEVLGSAGGLQLIVLDACRNNPVEADFKTKMASLSPELSRDGGASRGFARIDPRAGLLMTYSTASNSTAADGSGRNSPFTSAFLNNLKKPNMEVRQMLFRVQSEVYQNTNRTQLPEISSLYIGSDIVLNR